MLGPQQQQRPGTGPADRWSAERSQRSGGDICVHHQEVTNSLIIKILKKNDQMHKKIVFSILTSITTSTNTEF